MGDRPQLVTIVLLLVVLCQRNDVLAAGAASDSHQVQDFRALFVREVAAQGGALQAFDAPNCKSQITSPPANSLWTASYLIVQWRMCPMDQMSAASLVVRVDGHEMFRGHPSAARFTMHGIYNGWHTVEVVAHDYEGATLDFGDMTRRFQVERGESLLGSMYKRVTAGEFGRIDVEHAESENGDELKDDEQMRGEACSEVDDFTLVTAAINIGRRHGNISFEDDYIGNLRHILSLRCPTIIHLQERYVPLIEPFLHERAIISIKDIADLEAFKHAAAIEALRTSDTWAGSKKAYNPAKMQHYNALVMSKLYWLADVAGRNS